MTMLAIYIIVAAVLAFLADYLIHALPIPGIWQRGGRLALVAVFVLIVIGLLVSYAKG